jgi:hypothetical protein
MGHPRLHPIRARLLWLGGILFALAIAAPARAQYAMPQVPGFSNYYPWFNTVQQDQGDQSFQYFLANNPEIARELAGNPSLLYSAAWRSQFPQLRRYFRSHPYVWQSLNNNNWASGPAQTQYGDYDDQHQWRDAYWWHQNNQQAFYDDHQDWVSLNPRWRDRDGDYDDQYQWHDAYWWHQNNPDWFYSNHPEWASYNPQWRTQDDGAYDRQHNWHYGEWWYNQNPNWVASNHPNWIQQHQDWANQQQIQTFRRQQAMNQQQRFQ